MDGSHLEWTGFDSAEEAQSVVKSTLNALRSGRFSGEVVRKTWRVEILPEFAHLYLPGVQA